MQRETFFPAAPFATPSRPSASSPSTPHRDSNVTIDLSTPLFPTPSSTGGPSFFNQSSPFRSPTITPSHSFAFFTNSRTQPILNAHITNQPNPSISIPPELLGEIFHHAVASTKTQGFHLTRYTTFLDKERLAMRISQVCTYWRNVSLSLPELWTTIIFFPDGQHPAYARTRLRWIHIVLQRAHDRLLKAYLPAASKVGVFWLGQNLNRCSELFIDVDWVAEEVLALPWNLANNLARLGIQGEMCGRRTLDALLLLVNHLPRLKELEWSCHNPRYGTLPLAPISGVRGRQSNLEWRSLTSLVLGGTTYVEDCVLCLSQFLVLEEIQARSLVRPPLFMHQFRLSWRVVAKKLKVLDVYTPEDDVSELLNFLVLPSLEKLYVGSSAQYKHSGMSRLMPSLSELMERSRCAGTLKTLKIYDLPEADIAACLGLGLASLQSAQTSAIPSPVSSNDENRGPPVNAQSPVNLCLSNVEDLDVRCREERGFSDWTVGMLEYGRWGLFPRLRRLKMGRCSTQDGVIGTTVSSRVMTRGRDDTRVEDVAGKGKGKQGAVDDARGKVTSATRPRYQTASLEFIELYFSPFAAHENGWTSQHVQDMKILEDCRDNGVVVNVMFF